MITLLSFMWKRCFSRCICMLISLNAPFSLSKADWGVKKTPQVRMPRKCLRWVSTSHRLPDVIPLRFSSDIPTLDVFFPTTVSSSPTTEQPNTQGHRDKVGVRRRAKEACIRENQEWYVQHSLRSIGIVSSAVWGCVTLADWGFNRCLW